MASTDIIRGSIDQRAEGRVLLVTSTPQFGYEDTTLLRVVLRKNTWAEVNEHLAKLGLKTKTAPGWKRMSGGRLASLLVSA